MGVFKAIGRGLLYVILSPIILATFGLYCAYAAILFVYEFCIASYKFVTGDKLTVETIEDKKVKKYIERKKKEQVDKINGKEEPAAPQQSVNNFFINVSNPEDLNKIQNIAQSGQTEKIEMGDIPNIEAQEPNLLESKNTAEPELIEVPPVDDEDTFEEDEQ